MGTHAATTIRFTEEDREILAKLCALTGLDSSASAIRLAIREALTTREAQRQAAAGRKGRR